MKKLFTGIFFIGLLANLSASYYTSGFITYKYVSGNKFNVIVKLTNDCRGLDLGSTINLNVRDNINTNNSVNRKMNRSSIKEISWNNNGICKTKNFGVELYTYELQIDLDTMAGGIFKSTCKIYLSGQYCCRNGSINTFSPGNGYFTCMMDKCLVKDNSGPDIQNIHQNYFYINNSNYFNPIVYDSLDNDFLEFEPVNPLYDFNKNEVYNAPYSPRYPLSPFCSQSGQMNCLELPYAQPPKGIYYDSLNGNFIFTSTKANEVGTITYKIKEYRYINGVKQLIGFYYSDNYFVTGSVTVNPSITKNTLKLNHQFTAGKTGTIRLETQHSDTNKLDSVIVTCYNPIKGSSVSISKKWRPDITFTWTPECQDIRDEPYIFYVYFINENIYNHNPQTLAINVFVKSDLNLGNDTVICKNSSYLLKSNITGKYRWNNSGTDTFAQYTASQPGTYYLEVTRNNCVTGDSIRLKQIDSKPLVDLGKDTVICNQVPNSNIRLSVQYDPYYQYRWDRDTNFMYSFLNFRGTGWVSVRAVNVCGSSVDSILVSRESSPKMNLPKDTLICNTSQFMILPSPAGKGTYLWSNGQTDSVITVSSDGIYSLRYQNVCGAVSDTISIQFLNSPDFYLPHDTTVCNNQYPEFDFTDIKADFLWSDGSGNSKYTLKKAGQYWLKAVNDCGEMRDTVNLINLPTPEINLGRDSFYCKPFNLILKSTCESCTYLWNDNSNNAQKSVDHEGLYSLKAQNYCGIAIDSISVSADSFPVFHLPNDTIVREPVNIILRPDKLYASRLWNTGDTSVQITADKEGKYWLKQSNACGELTDTIHIKRNTSVVEILNEVISLYPNPVTDILNVESDMEIQSFRLFDHLGREFEVNFKSDSHHYFIDLTQISEGLYTLEIKINDNVYYRIISVKPKA